MQGGCRGPVPVEVEAAVANWTVPLRPLAPYQCLLLVDRGGFQVLGEGSVWLDNLYIRKVSTAATHPKEFSLMTTGQWDAAYQATVSTSAEPEPFALRGPPRVFLTGVRLQGDGVFRIQDSSGGWQYHSAHGIAVAAPTYVSGASSASGCPTFSTLAHAHHHVVPHCRACPVTGAPACA